MRVDDHVVRLVHGDAALVGVAHVPASPSSTGVVVVVGGPQYRVGSHRQFVHLGRGLASHGHAVLRFDALGMGDSAGDFPGFEHLGADIGAAIDALQQQVPAVRRVVLWGLCDGASAALLYLDGTRDRRVAGLCIANPWVRDAASLARTHVRHYYAQRLLQPAFWRKLLRGGVGLEALRGWVINLAAARRPAADDALGFQARMAREWRRFDGPTLLLLSGNDYTAKEFLEHAGARPQEWPLARASLRRVDLPDVDHTFSTPGAKERVLECTAEWLHGVTAQVSRDGDLPRDTVPWSSPRAAT